MKKIIHSLPFRLLAGVIIGILLGLLFGRYPEASVSAAFMNVIVSLKQILGEIINFCVPLIVIGFIAPSITTLGKSASRMLGVALLIAAMSADGRSVIQNVEQIDRGYQNIDGRLNAIGADIRRID